MTVPDPKWLAILKASGWQCLAICGACCVFVAFAQWGYIGHLDEWVLQLATFAALLTGFLAIASMLSALFRFVPPAPRIKHFLNIRAERKRARRYIHNMTPQEKDIIGYLLANNQSTFVGARDGGYAMPLISNGIIVRALVAGQVYDSENTPFAIPEHVWKELQLHRSRFPFDLNRHDGRHPWRIPWMVR